MASGLHTARSIAVLAALAVCTALCVPLPALPAAAVAGSGPSGSGGAWPLEGQVRVVHAFDPPAQRWSAGHRGVDLLGRPGAAVRAAASGTVAFAGPIAGRGVVVVGHPDGTRTTYEPVTATVSVGAAVRAGDTLGRLVGAGGHCLPAACLHWGRLRGDVYLDPMLIVRGGPMRLLPVWAGAPRPGPAGSRAAAAARRGPGPATAGQTAGAGPPSALRLVAAGSTGMTLLAAGALLAVRRRRTQSNAGSAVASRV